MLNIKSMIAKDLHHVWHPCSIMKDFEKNSPLVIQSAQGAYIETNQGRLIDGISSWWCKSLGHGHPAIRAAVDAQLNKFEHVMPANTTHPTMVALAEALSDISNKQHVFFASDGACAVEISIKIALQAALLKGQPQRNQIIALKNAYHGETLGALSVSDLGIYKKAWDSFGVTCHFLDPIPYVSGITDPLWQDADQAWSVVQAQLEPLVANACAIIVEPILQGAHGLRPYSADFLAKLFAFAKQHDLYFIADEIMTGLGRTGEWLASNHAQISPDMICLSKGLTAGFLPLSCVLIDHDLYELFYHETDPTRCFLHSHTFSGHALGVAAALATLQTMQAEDMLSQARALGDYMQQRFAQVINQTGHFSNLRALGAVVAADFVSPHHPHFNAAFIQAAQEKGALLRPIGKTLYWLPPLNTSFQTIDELAEITLQALQIVLKDPLKCTASV